MFEESRAIVDGHSTGSVPEQVTLTQRDKTRLQIDLDPARLQRLEALMLDCGLATKKELFDYAIVFMEWAVKHRKKAKIIGAIDADKDTYIEIELPPLSYAASRAQK